MENSSSAVSGRLIGKTLLLSIKTIVDISSYITAICHSLLSPREDNEKTGVAAFFLAAEMVNEHGA